MPSMLIVKGLNPCQGCAYLILACLTIEDCIRKAGGLVQGNSCVQERIPPMRPHAQGPSNRLAATRQCHSPDRRGTALHLERTNPYLRPVRVIGSWRFRVESWDWFDTSLADGNTHSQPPCYELASLRSGQTARHVSPTGQHPAAPRCCRTTVLGSSGRPTRLLRK